MITDEKALNILEGLLSKSRLNQVNWQMTNSEVTDLNHATSFVVYFPESSVELEFDSPRVEPDRFLVSFNNKAGITVKRLTVDEEHPSWQMVQSLFDEAGRVTVGWDKVFDDLENAVKSKEKIGLTPTNYEDPF